jgi:hypothetical protein
MLCLPQFLDHQWKLQPSINIDSPLPQTTLLNASKQIERSWSHATFASAPANQSIALHVEENIMQARYSLAPSRLREAVLCQQRSVWRTSGGISESRKPQLRCLLDESARVSVDVEECWWSGPRNDSVVANFNFDIARGFIERNVVDLSL